MKQVRLLPVVIFATLALLVFKGVGLVTQGGYVLSGVGVARASGDAPAGAAAEMTPDAAIDVGPTMADGSPTMVDSSPTLPGNAAEAGGHGAPAGETAPEGEDHSAAPEAQAEDGKAADAALATLAAITCTPAGAPAPATPPLGEQAAPVSAACPPDSDEEAVVLNSQGEKIPLSEADGGQVSEDAILGRLSERRAQLDARETELNMRLSLLEAAEKRMAERQTALEQLEAQVNALVDQKKAAEEEQFKALVSMYETMKPKEAALILNDLDIKVMLRVARAMNPRKMAPIMAKMVPEKAQALTIGLAADNPDVELAATAEDLSSLPQIVGQ